MFFGLGIKIIPQLLASKTPISLFCMEKMINSRKFAPNIVAILSEIFKKIKKNWTTQNFFEPTSKSKSWGNYWVSLSFFVNSIRIKLIWDVNLSLPVPLFSKFELFQHGYHLTSS